MDRAGPINVGADVFRAYAAGQTPRLPSGDGPLQVRAARAVDVFQTTGKVEGASRLLAGGVPGRVDFAGAAPASGGLPMYRHPADRNVAATAVTLGRLIDAQG